MADAPMNPAPPAPVTLADIVSAINNNHEAVRGDLNQLQATVDANRAHTDSRFSVAQDVVNTLDRQVQNLVANTVHHGAMQRPPVLADPMAFTQPKYYAALCTSAAEPSILLQGARSYIQACAARGNCKAATLTAALEEFDACSDIIRPILCQLGDARASDPSVAAYSAFRNNVLRLGALVESGRADAQFLFGRLGANGAGSEATAALSELAKHRQANRHKKQEND